MSKVRVALTATGALVLGLSGCAGEAAPRPGGYDVGKIVADHTFNGRPAGIDSERKDISLASYKATHKLLVLNVAAQWCSPCKEEAKEIQSTVAPKYAGKVAFVSVVLEDINRAPASDLNIDNWIRAFSISNFAVVRDDKRWVANFFDPSTMPLNVVIDLATMKILHKQIGGNLGAVEAAIDKNLGG